MKLLTQGQNHLTRFLVLCALLTWTLSLQAQQYKVMMEDNSVNFYDVVRAADDYFESHDKGKGSGWKDYQRWKSENESKFAPDGDRSGVDPYFAEHGFEAFMGNQSHGKRSFDNGWIELGPDNANNVTAHYSPGIGRVECQWVDPTNSSLIYLGSRSGGFWKTTNSGSTWENTTDFLAASGVNTMTVSPTNSDSILINVKNAQNNTSHGLYRSIDGGSTWVESNFNPSTLGWGGLGSNAKINKVVYHPTVPNLIFIGSNKGLYRSSDNLKTWTRYYNNNNILDIEFHPTDKEVVYIYNASTKGSISVSDDMGLTYNASGNLNGNTSNGYIEVSKACPSCVYYASTQGIWKSLDQGSSFRFLGNPDQNCKGFAVSDVDTTKMVYGYVDLLASEDGGETFEQVTDWNNPTPDETYVHADLRTLEFVNGKFYAGTDGYLASSDDNGKSWTRISDGTAIRENYAVGISQSNSYVHIAGSQDNGTSILLKDGWLEWNGGDGMECLVQPLNPDWMIGSWQYGGRNQTKDGGQTRNYLNTTQTSMGQTDWIAPLLLDPMEQMRVYHFSDVIFASNEFGNSGTWSLLSNPGIGVIKLAAIARTDNKKMVICRNSDLQLSTDGGKTFEPIVDGLPGYNLTDVEFDPNHSNTLILGYNRYQNDGKKIYISHDLGESWENITYNLGNMPIRSLTIDHSAERNIYVGAEIGVYYKAMADTVWQLYNPGFPNVSVRDLEVQYGANLLKAATWGRGLWEFTLADRDDYPSIVETHITHPPTELRPAADVAQFVTSTILYDGTLSNVSVYWSADSTSLDSVLAMSNTTGNEWKSDQPIPGQPEGTKLYFKVVAVGSNTDTSETYSFMYTVNQALVGVESLQANEFPIAIHPNPTDGRLVLLADENLSGSTVELTDVTGKQIATGSISGVRNLELEILGESGVYLVTIRTTNGEVYTQKVLKE
ncbi:MAG: T9SS type A sorting domain-containing protein [Bacteroidia bacterium]|nr:T9SS type A sorting domain-containing protein [Bacteroidia bacterium]